MGIPDPSAGSNSTNPKNLNGKNVGQPKSIGQSGYTNKHEGKERSPTCAEDASKLKIDSQNHDKQQLELGIGQDRGKVLIDTPQSIGQPKPKDTPAAQGIGQHTPKHPPAASTKIQTKASVGDGNKVAVANPEPNNDQYKGDKVQGIGQYNRQKNPTEDQSKDATLKPKEKKEKGIGQENPGHEKEEKQKKTPNGNASDKGKQT